MPTRLSWRIWIFPIETLTLLYLMKNNFMKQIWNLEKAKDLNASTTRRNPNVSVKNFTVSRRAFANVRIINQTIHNMTFRLGTGPFPWLRLSQGLRLWPGEGTATRARLRLSLSAGKSAKSVFPPTATPVRDT